jgi:hypothetical protein
MVKEIALSEGSNVRTNDRILLIEPSNRIDLELGDFAGAVYDGV